jgi:hypothetical protein
MERIHRNRHATLERLISFDDEHSRCGAAHRSGHADVTRSIQLGSDSAQR